MQQKTKNTTIMDTEKFKKQGDKAKGGKNTTQTILTAGGAMAAGGVVGAVAGNVLHPDPEPKPEPKPQPEPDPNKPDPNKPDEPNKPENPETPEKPQTPDTPEKPDTPDIPDKPEPDKPEPDKPEPDKPEPDKPEPQTPDEIAQAIIAKDEIDENDLDVPDVVAIESFTTVFDENGNELAAAMVRTPDGTSYVLADLDGDGIYEGVLNTDGYLVAQAEANLTHSDLEAMMNGDGGYLALNEQDKTTIIDDPTGDIILTDDPSTDIAQNEEHQDDGSDVDDLIAQLLDGRQSGDSNDEVIVDESVPGDEDAGEEEADDDDNEDSDDDSEEDDSEDDIDDDGGLA